MNRNIEWDIYLGASLRQPGSAIRNEAIQGLAVSNGMKIYVPKLDPGASASEILERNKLAVMKSSVFLFVPDEAGEGVYYELGFADALGKTIIGYSETGVSALGKMTRGIWESLPDQQRCNNRQTLNEALLFEKKNLI